MRNVLIIKPYKQGCNLYLDNGEIETVEVEPIELIKELCILNGSSLEGRISCFKYLTSTRQKPCIMIKEGLIYIPTLSLKNIECSYLLYDRIVWVKKDGYDSIVLFDNGLKLDVDISHRTIKKQIKRCDLFIKKLLSKDNMNYKSVISRMEKKCG